MAASLPNPRYERKFVIQGLSLAEILAIVRRHPSAFREAFPPRMVNNVYLDSPPLNDFHDHVNGIGKRSKTRVRWYGTWEGNIEKPVLERKLKWGLLGGKTASALPPIHLNGEGVRPPLGRAFANADLPESTRARLPFLKPTLCNRYRRHYFVSADGCFRLTVDSDLAFGAPGPRAPQPDQAFGEPVVLELKFAPEQSEKVEVVTNAFPFRMRRCSKYVMGIERTRFSI